MKFVRMFIDTAVAATGKLLRLSGRGRTGETFTGLVAPQQFGFGSCPPEGAMALVSLDKNGAIVISTDDARYRLSYKNGESMIYSHEGVKVHLQSGKKVEISGADEINLGGGESELDRLVTFEDLKTYLDALTLPVSGGTAGPPTTPLPESCGTNIVRAK